MILREDTVIQVRGAMGQMDTVHDQKFVEEVVTGTPRTNRAPRCGPVQPNKTCLGNVMFHSVFKGRNKKVKFLLNQGININNPNDYGYNVLIAALHISDDGHRDKMFRYLISRDADSLARDRKHGRNVFSWACLLGRTDQVRLLLEEFAGNTNLNATDTEGMTALHHATQAGHVDIVRILINELKRYDLSVDTVDRLGLTPYLHAKRLGYKNIAVILRIEGGASPGHADWYTFKSPTTWEKLGSNERQQMAIQKLEDDFYKAAITGGEKGVQLFELALREKVPLKIVASRTDGNKSAEPSYESDSASVVESMTDSNSTINVHRSRDEVNHQESFNGVVGIQASSDAVSLLDLAAKYRGRVPTHFCSSQIDESKAEEYKRFAGSMDNVMRVWSHQRSLSYRKPIGVRQPFLGGLRDNKRNISSLAILLRKDTKNGKHSAKKSSKGDKKTAKSQSTGKK